MKLLNTIACLGLCSVILTIPASASSPSEFSDHAVSSASQWARQNPNGIAVAIYLGSATPVTPDVIEEVLRKDFGTNGVSELQFFFERGGEGGSSVVFRSRNHVWGPFGLALARDHVPQAASQLRFEIERGLN